MEKKKTEFSRGTLCLVMVLKGKTETQLSESHVRVRLICNFTHVGWEYDGVLNELVG